MQQDGERYCCQRPLGDMLLDSTYSCKVEYTGCDEHYARVLSSYTRCCIVLAKSSGSTQVAAAQRLAAPDCSCSYKLEGTDGCISVPFCMLLQSFGLLDDVA